MHLEGAKLCEGGDRWRAHTSFSQPQNKTVKGGEKRQCNGCCLKQKKEKCSGATCPLPVSHAAVSPLVGEPWDRALSPGQSAARIRPICKSFQVSSTEGGDWSGPRRGRGEQRDPTSEPHLKQAERRQTGFFCRDAGVLSVNNWTGMHFL